MKYSQYRDGWLVAKAQPLIWGALDVILGAEEVLIILIRTDISPELRRGSDALSKTCPSSTIDKDATKVGSILCKSRGLVLKARVREKVIQY